MEEKCSDTFFFVYLMACYIVQCYRERGVVALASRLLLLLGEPQAIKRDLISASWSSPFRDWIVAKWDSVNQ